jgi:hypothetical protein
MVFSQHRLKQGKARFEIFCFCLDEHPRGLKRREIQEMLKDRLGVGESVGGINRHIRALREAVLIDWDQKSYTYKISRDFNSKQYFIRAVEAFKIKTDQAYFLSLKMRRIISDDVATEIDDYIGHKYDIEMSDNIKKLENEYKVNEIHVHEDIKKLLKHHNSYVRLRLFKTMDECFINDINRLEKTEETKRLLKGYLKNMESIHREISLEKEQIFRLRESAISHLREKRLSKRMKFLIRFALNHVRPSHVFDGMI